VAGGVGYILATDPMYLVDRSVRLHYWTWGSSCVGFTGTDLFFRNYYGMLVATIRGL
jgi:hypothetical protein